MAAEGDVGLAAALLCVAAEVLPDATSRPDYEGGAVVAVLPSRDVDGLGLPLRAPVSLAVVVPRDGAAPIDGYTRAWVELTSTEAFCLRLTKVYSGVWYRRRDSAGDSPLASEVLLSGGGCGPGCWVPATCEYDYRWVLSGHAGASSTVRLYVEPVPAGSIGFPSWLACVRRYLAELVEAPLVSSCSAATPAAVTDAADEFLRGLLDVHDVSPAALRECVRSAPRLIPGGLVACEPDVLVVVLHRLENAESAWGNGWRTAYGGELRSRLLCAALETGYAQEHPQAPCAALARASIVRRFIEPRVVRAQWLHLLPWVLDEPRVSLDCVTAVADELAVEHAALALRLLELMSDGRVAVAGGVLRHLVLREAAQTELRRLVGLLDAFRKCPWPHGDVARQLADAARRYVGDRCTFLTATTLGVVRPLPDGDCIPGVDAVAAGLHQLLAGMRQPRTGSLRLLNVPLGYVCRFL